MRIHQSLLTWPLCPECSALSFRYCILKFFFMIQRCARDLPRYLFFCPLLPVHGLGQADCRKQLTKFVFLLTKLDDYQMRLFLYFCSPIPYLSGFSSRYFIEKWTRDPPSTCPSNKEFCIFFVFVSFFLIE